MKSLWDKNEKPTRRRRKIIKEHFPVCVAWRQSAALRNFSTTRDILKLSLKLVFFFNFPLFFLQNLPGSSVPVQRADLVGGFNMYH